jgi:hypothetical protein
MFRIADTDFVDDTLESTRTRLVDFGQQTESISLLSCLEGDCSLENKIQHEFKCQVLKTASMKMSFGKLRHVFW